jgi:MoxR-like ATPase
MNTNLKKSILNIAKKTPKVPFLVGKAGEGKTQFIKDLCNELKLTLVILNASALEAADFTGLPYIKDGETYFSRPNFFSYDVIFLDELDRVTNSEVRQSLLSLFNDRKINGHDFKGLIFSAGNGKLDGYETIEFDIAFKDRLAPVTFSHTVQEKIDYLKNKHGKDNTLLQFLEAKTEIFNQVTSRTLDHALCVSDDLLAVKILLGKELSKGYQTFINGGLVSLDQVASGQYDLDKLTALTRVTLVNELMNGFNALDEEYTDEELKNINEFLNELSAEEKALYFSKLKEYRLKSDDFETVKDLFSSLNKRGFFKGQKAYFNELIGV